MNKLQKHKHTLWDGNDENRSGDNGYIDDTWQVERYPSLNPKLKEKKESFVSS